MTADEPKDRCCTMSDQPTLPVRGWKDMSYCQQCFAVVPDVFFTQHLNWHETLAGGVR